MRDEGGEGIAEILHRHIGKGINLYGSGKGCHNNRAEAVDESLYHKDTEIHDRLLNTGQSGEGYDLTDAFAAQAADLPYRANLRIVKEGVGGNTDAGNILCDHGCLCRSGNTPVQSDHEPEVKSNV